MNRFFRFVLFVMALLIGLSIVYFQIDGSLSTYPIQPLPSPTDVKLSVATSQIETCVVGADALNVRSDPSEKATVINWLVRNDVVTILNDQPIGNWVRIRIDDQTGWINSNYCEKGK